MLVRCKTRLDNTYPTNMHNLASQSKPVIMLSTFCGAFDVPHRKKADKTIPALADMYSENMGV